MNKTLISIEERKQIALREIHIYPGCEDYPPSAFIPSQMRWPKAIGLSKS